MTVLITLTLAGTDTGPFDLYSDLDGYITPFETGVSKAALLAGYLSSLVPDGTTSILVRSTGVCDRDLYLNVEGYPATTTTTSTSTTSAPLINNCITPLLNNETVGAQVFVRLTADYTLTSTVTVNVSVTTQYDTYTSSDICAAGTITSNHKFVFTSGNPDESAYLVTINSISPASDSTYNYVNCI